jgi:hypothetical protein
MALEAMLDLPPLPDLVKKAAAQWIVCVRNARLDKTKSWGHAGTIGDLQEFLRHDAPNRISRDGDIRPSSSNLVAEF